MPQVLFAGYKVPHPLHPYFLVKIQTDGTITPTAALEQACTKLIGTLSSLEAKFKREFSFKDVEGVATEDPYGTANAGPAWATGAITWTFKVISRILWNLLLVVTCILPTMFVILPVLSFLFFFFHSDR